MTQVSRSRNTVNGDLKVIGGDVTIDNAKQYSSKSTGGVKRSLLSISTGNFVTFGNTSYPMIHLSSAAVDIQAGVKLDDDSTVRTSMRGNATNWIYFDMAVAAGSADLESHNVDSLTDLLTGTWTVNFPTKSNANYSVIGTSESDALDAMVVNESNRATGSVRVYCKTGANVLKDKKVNVAIFDIGDV